MTFLKIAASIGMAASTACAPLLAQLHDNTDKQLSCSNNGSDRDRARHCEIREMSLPSIGRLSVDASPNGGVTIKGWLRGDVLVRARVEASGENPGAAANLVSRVQVDASGGQVRATGPESRNESSWSVGYEIFVPQISDVTLKTINGGLTVSDVRGQIHFDTINGGVNVKRVIGEVSGATINGGINVELADLMPSGRPMELTTHNGGVSISMPSRASARIQAETGMGRIHSDFPMPPSTVENSRRMDFSVGGGGPLIHIKTENGGIQVKRSETM